MTTQDKTAQRLQEIAKYTKRDEFDYLKMAALAGEVELGKMYRLVDLMTAAINYARLASLNPRIEIFDVEKMGYDIDLIYMICDIMKECITNRNR